MYLLFAVFDLVTLAADCVLSRIVILTSICDLVTCVLNWCEIIFECVIRPEVSLREDAKSKDLTNRLSTTWNRK